MAVVAMLRIGTRTNQGLRRGVMLSDRRGPLVPSQRSFFSRYPMRREDNPSDWQTAVNRLEETRRRAERAVRRVVEDRFEKRVLLAGLIVILTASVSALVAILFNIKR